MIYEVRARLFFDTILEAEGFSSECVKAMDDAVVVHPDDPNQQGCSVEIIMCYHDETPTKPCVSCGEIHCHPD